MPTPAQIAAKFAAIDVHDDTVEGFSFVPGTSGRSRATVEVALFRHWTGVRRIIRFSRCANFGVALDTDVLLQNSPSATSVFRATADHAAIQGMMRRHKRSWNLRYDKVIDPLPVKLAASGQYVLFTVALHGGTLDIIAKSFSISRGRKSR